MKGNKNLQIAAYLKPRAIKQHEKELLEIIHKDYPRFSGHVLDIGCSNGNFIKAMSAIYPHAHYTGIDTSKALIDIAREKLTNSNVTLEKVDTMAYKPDNRFDIIIASGILSIFEDFEPVLEKWLSWLKDRSRLYIFGRFNTKNIDTIIRFRNNYQKTKGHPGGEWEGGLTSYSVQTVSKHLKLRGFTHIFKRFHLNIEMPEREDPIRTYIVRLTNGSKLVINGANIIAEHYFLIIQNQSL